MIKGKTFKAFDISQISVCETVTAQVIFEWGGDQFARAPKSVWPPLGAEGPYFSEAPEATEMVL